MSKPKKNYVRVSDLPVLDCVLFAVRYHAIDKEKDILFQGDSWCGTLGFKVRGWQQLKEKLEKASNCYLEKEGFCELTHFVSSTIDEIDKENCDKITAELTAVSKPAKIKIKLNEDDFYLFARAPSNDEQAPQMECLEVNGIIGGKKESVLVYNFDIKLELETFVPECFCEKWDLEIQNELKKINQYVLEAIKEHCSAVMVMGDIKYIYGFDASANVLAEKLPFIKEQLVSLDENQLLKEVVPHSNQKSEKKYI